MEKMKALGTVFAVFFVSIMAGCSGCTDPPPEIQPSNPVNIIVILDTSDRISKVKKPGQVQKDINIAKGIVDIFEKLVRQELYIHSHHRLAFVVPKQPNTTPIPQDIIKKLIIWPTDEDRRRGAPRFRTMKTELLQTIDKLYQFVEKRQEFTGADIWDWFRASGVAYLKANMQNYIICLSDGYLDFNRNIQVRRPKRGQKTSYISYRQVVEFRNDPNWKQKFDSEGHGLLEIGKDFSTYDVKFLMVEIAHRDMLDLDIIKAYWQKWLSSMGINNWEFVEAQPDPKIVKEKIKGFISPHQ